MTNADVIRQMTNEQLAVFLDNYADGEIDVAKTFCDLCCKEAALDGRSTDCGACTAWWLNNDSKNPQGLNYFDEMESNA